MARRFLIGRFLPSHSSAYRFRERRIPDGATITPETLSARFSERARRFRAQRGKYAVTFQAGLALALLTVVAAFNLNIHPGDRKGFELPTQELVTVQEIIQTRQDIKPPPPPRPPIPVEVPNDEVLEEDDLTFDAALDIGIGAPLPPPPALEQPEDEGPEDEIFIIVEEMPTIVGGLSALSADLEYPLLARRAGIEGTSVIRVLVNRDGTPSDATVLRSAHDLLDQAALDAVLKQRFTPGRQRGAPVLVYMALPVRFALSD